MLKQQKFARRLGQSFPRRVKIHPNVIVRLVLDGEPKTGSDEEQKTQRGYDQKIATAVCTISKWSGVNL
jgi:hypothetical protein